MALWRARAASSSLFSRLLQPVNRSSFAAVDGGSSSAQRYFSISADATADANTLKETMKRELLHLDINSQTGSNMPLSSMRIGTIIHNIEMRPGQGGKLVRAAGTCAKIMKEPKDQYCVIKLPSGVEKVIDSRCRATIGVVSNASHGAKKLRKAGHSRWLGRRPVVRGVAMNPVDHPHGGGEGKSKSSGKFGGVSRTPWGKPTKSGYKTGPLKRKK
ncbi:60S ribosomal protein L2, mitochondrial [Linum grandiflorum]